MKNKVLLCCLTLGAAMCCGVATTSFSKGVTPVVDEKGAPITSHDEVGEAINFKNHRFELGEDETLSIHSSLGVQVFEEANGNKSLRFVAPVSSYRGISSATFHRVMKSPDGEIYKQSTDFSVDKVYTSLVEQENVKYDVAPAEGLSYYFVYTMKNLPEDFWFHTLLLSIDVVDDEGHVYSASQSANVKGVEGDVSKNVQYVENGDGTYGAMLPYKEGTTDFDTTVTSVVVNDYYMTIDGFVATNHGKVTKLKARSSYTGAFESATKLTDIVLPDSIEEYEKYAFYSCNSLNKLTFTRDLKVLGSSVFSNLNTIRAVDYRSTKLETYPTSYIFNVNVPEMTIRRNVEELPVNSGSLVLNSGKKIEKVIFEGTTAQYTALIDGKSSDWDVEEVYCDDTTYTTVNFHVGDGSLVVGSETYTGDSLYTKVCISGRKVANPGRPTHDSMKFIGWYADEAFTTPYDFDSLLSGETVDIYAKYAEWPAGSSMVNPIVLSVDGTYNIESDLDTVWTYLSFTAPQNDYYYFKLGKSVKNEDLPSSSTGDISPRIEVRDIEGNDYSVSSFDATKDQKVSGFNDSTVCVKMTAGEAISLRVNPAYNYSETYYAYGSVPLSVYTRENDSQEEAIVYSELGTRVESILPEKDDRIYHKFVPETTGAYVVTGSNEGGIWYSYTVIDENGNVKDTSNSTNGVRGTSETAKIYNFEAGHTYYFVCKTNSKLTEEQHIYLTISSAPAGASKESAIEATIGTDISVTIPTGLSNVYYTFDVTEKNTYFFKVSGGNTSARRSATILDSTGSVVNTCTVSIDADETKNDVVLEPGTYTIEAKYFDSPLTKDTFTISVNPSPAGYSILNAIDLTLSETMTFTPEMTGKYYKFVSDNEIYNLFSATSEGTAQIKLSTYSSQEYVTATMASELSAKFINGETYYLYVSASTQDVVVSYSTAEHIEDGKTLDTAYLASTFFTDGSKTISNFAGEKIYVKFECSETGTYRFWSYNLGENDTKGYILNESGSTASGSYVAYNDDAAYAIREELLSSGVIGYKYDFYMEADLQAGTTYYLYFYGASKTTDLTVNFILLPTE